MSQAQQRKWMAFCKKTGLGWCWECIRYMARGKGYYILYQYLVLIFGYGAQSTFISQRYKGRWLRTSPCICRENTAWFFAKCLLCNVLTGIHLWDVQFIHYPSRNTQLLSGEYVVHQHGWYGFSPISYDMAIEHSKPWQYNTICTDNQHRQRHIHMLLLFWQFFTWSRIWS